MIRLYRWVGRMLGFYRPHMIDEQVANKLAAINKMVDERLRLVKLFDQKLINLLDANKVVTFVRSEADHYVVNVTDDAVTQLNRNVLKSHIDVTPQQALLNMRELTDDDFVGEMAREFVTFAEGMPDELRVEVLKHL